MTRRGLFQLLIVAPLLKILPPWPPVFTPRFSFVMVQDGGTFRISTDATYRFGCSGVRRADDFITGQIVTSLTPDMRRQIDDDLATAHAAYQETLNG